MSPTHPPPQTTTTHGGFDGGGPPKQPQPQPQKIRLMISYGGHILPRPDNKTLIYAGGETRLISAERTTALSLSLLHTHLSKSLFNGSHQNNNNFILKYQLPNNDLDSLISISSDEDLYNMLDEYDRVGSTGRMRFFVFNKEDDVDVKFGGGVDDDLFIDALKVTGSSLGGGGGNGGGGGGNGGGEEGGSPESIVFESSSSFGSNNSNVNRGGDDFKLVLPSLDSFGSDNSIPSPNFSQQTIMYQDASGFVDSKVTVNLVETESSASDHSPRSDLLTPVQVSGYMISKPSMDQPRYPTPPPSPPAHYLYHPTPPSQSNYVTTQYYPSSVPLAYTPMYQTYVQPQQHFQYQSNNPYPVYMMPVSQTQTPSMHCLTTTPTVSSSQTPQPQVSSNPVVVASSMVYEGYKPTTSGPEYAAKVYGPVSVATKHINSPLPVTQPSQAQPVSVPSPENTKYISDYEDPLHAQIYKTQPSGPTLSSQLHMLPESFAQLQVENAKH